MSLVVVIVAGHAESQHLCRKFPRDCSCSQDNHEGHQDAVEESKEAQGEQDRA